jgi:hypothetical protein
MKRWLLMALFAVLGFVYPFLVVVVHSAHVPLDPDSMVRGVSDNEGEILLRIQVLLGGTLFLCLWAWIGNVVAADWKQGAAMLVSSIAAGISLFLMTGRLIRMDLPGSNLLPAVAALLAWFAASALAAYVAYRLTRPQMGAARA